MPEHLCLIWITSMTPVQMVTGCDHLKSPVPIHLPVNGSFDTLCACFFFFLGSLTWLPPFWTHHESEKKNDVTRSLSPPSPPQSCYISKRKGYFPLELLTYTWQSVSPIWCHSFEILMSNCPLLTSEIGFISVVKGRDDRQINLPFTSLHLRHLERWSCTNKRREIC